MDFSFEDSAPSSFRKQLIALSLLFVAIVATVTWMVVSRSQQQLIEFNAVKIAEIVAQQTAIARSTYSKLAVTKLERDGFGADADSELRSGHVPLPAQFLRELSHETLKRNNGLYRFQPISQWNIGPNQGLVDDFQQWAWSALLKQDEAAPTAPISWQPIWRVEDVSGASTLRYMRADPASSESCVNCHNRIERQPDVMAARTAAGIEPGRQWQRYQLMGAIQIDIPLERAAALALEQTQFGLLIVVAVTIIGLAGVCFLFFVDSSRNKAMREKLAWQAHHDSLTGLPNRMAFDQALNTLLESTLTDDQEHVVMLLDLDHFKKINDTLGHEAGDSVLQITSRRLSTALRDDDFVARLGGDEFAVLLPNTDHRRAEELAQRLSDAIEEPYGVGSHQLECGVSVGIAVIPDHGQSATEIVRCADVAMYAAKVAQLPFASYNTEQDQNHDAHRSLIDDLKGAVRDNTLELRFQPRYELASQKMIGAEALLRWSHPLHGSVSPERIVAIAERAGFITDITQWILVESLAQCRLWQQAGFPLQVSINLSEHDLRDPLLVERVAKAMMAAELDAPSLVLDIPEAALLVDPSLSESILCALHDRGVKLSIDNYGDGNCSLSFLNRLPLHELKLNQKLTQAPGLSVQASALVKANIGVAHNLCFLLSAKGVEDADSLRWLEQADCDVVQGRYLSEPLSASEFLDRLPALHCLDGKHIPAHASHA